MSLSPLVPLLLAACWVLPVAIIAVLHNIRARGESDSAPREMKTSLKGVRVDVGQMDIDARSQDWRNDDWKGPEARVAARVTDSSREVMVITPYAEASVSVQLNTGDGEEQRRCSLCLN